MLQKNQQKKQLINVFAKKLISILIWLMNNNQMLVKINYFKITFVRVTLFSWFVFYLVVFLEMTKLRLLNLPICLFLSICLFCCMYRIRLFWKLSRKKTNGQKRQIGLIWKPQFGYRWHFVCVQKWFKEATLDLSLFW